MMLVYNYTVGEQKILQKKVQFFSGEGAIL